MVSEHKAAFMEGAMLPSDVRDAVMNSGEVVELAEGDLLFQENDRGDSMYVVEQGAVRVILGHGAASKLIGPGQFLGEISLLAPELKRTATAVAHRPSRLRILTQETIKQLRETHPDLLYVLLQETCLYLVTSERELLDEVRQKNRELEAALDYLRRTKEDLKASDLLAQTDELTTLYNRRCFNQQLPRFVERATLSGTSFSLLLVDIDHFKQINDSYGHAVGDQALCAVANLLRASTRQSDFPCRIGGDEFAVLLGHTSLETATKRADDIVRAIASLHVESAGSPVPFTVSMGGAMYRNGDGVEQLTERADKALYQAKEGGRNQFAWSSLDA